MIAERAALDAAQMAALVIIRERQMGDAAGFPEPNGVAPLGLLAGGGDAGVNADRRRIAAGLLGHMAQSVERDARLSPRPYPHCIQPSPPLTVRPHVNSAFPPSQSGPLPEA